MCCSQNTGEPLTAVEPFLKPAVSYNVLLLVGDDTELSVGPRDSASKTENYAGSVHYIFIF